MIHQSIPALRRTVMVIVSDRANFELVTQLIARRDDLKLLTATQGQQGVEMTTASQPDVVVMDTGLPDISGLEALKKLRDNFSTAHIPVIALSSDAHQTYIDLGLNAGFFRYLTKPFRLADLLGAIDDAVRFNPRSSAPVAPASNAGGGAAGACASLRRPLGGRWRCRKPMGDSVGPVPG